MLCRQMPCKACLDMLYATNNTPWWKSSAKVQSFLEKISHLKE